MPNESLVLVKGGALSPHSYGNNSSETLRSRVGPQRLEDLKFSSIELSLLKAGLYKVGYNSDGFYVQNSWGDEWGNEGVGVWTYEDWAKNIMDAWVFRLALPEPKIFGLRAGFES